MSDFSQAVYMWSAKGIGALAGSAISIAYMLPKGRREAALRLCVGLVTGLVFGTTAGIKIATSLDVIERLSPAEVMLMGAAAASLFSWWGLGMIARLSAQYHFLLPFQSNNPPINRSSKK
jgi:hypothetical protein